MSRQSPAPATVIRKSVPLVRAGELWKKGAERQNWKKRWFELRSHSLAYFTSRKAKVPKGEIPLMNIFIEDVEHKSREHVFSINGCNRTFYLAAETDEMKTIWMKDILSCANEVIRHDMPLPNSDNTIRPSLHELQTPKRKVLLFTSGPKDRDSVESTESTKNEEEECSADLLFPDNYEELSKDELILLLCHVEMKYRELEKHVQIVKEAENSED